MGNVSVDQVRRTAAVECGRSPGVCGEGEARAAESEAAYLSLYVSLLTLTTKPCFALTLLCSRRVWGQKPL